MSLYDFDDHITDYFSKNNTLSGFDGLVYMPDEFILDIDGKDKDDLENARQKTIGLTLLLDDLGIPDYPHREDVARNHILFEEVGVA